MNDISTLIFTANGVAIYRERLVRKQAEYADIREQRKNAFEMSGDGWHDNPEFNRLQQLEANLNADIKRMLDALDSARVVEIRDGNRCVEEVAIGSLVAIRRWTRAGEQPVEIWEIGGHADSDGACLRVAYDAPLGAALMGAQPGDFIENFRAGNGICDIEILALFRDRASAITHLAA